MRLAHDGEVGAISVLGLLLATGSIRRKPSPKCKHSNPAVSAVFLDQSTATPGSSQAAAASASKEKPKAIPMPGRVRRKNSLRMIQRKNPRFPLGLALSVVFWPMLAFPLKWAILDSNQ